MTTVLRAAFMTRRNAEMAIEQITQEYQVDPVLVSVAVDSQTSSSGTLPAGGDLRDGLTKPQNQGGPQLAGRLIVSAEVDEAVADNIIALVSTFKGAVL